MQTALAVLLFVPFLALPRRIDRIGDAVEHGRLRLNIRLFSDEGGRQVVTGLVHQTLLTVIGAVAGIMGTLLLGSGQGPRISADISLFPLLGYGFLIVAVVLVLPVLAVVLRRG